MRQSSKYEGIPDGEGNCYDTALEKAGEMHRMLRQWPQARASLFVCHGIAIGQGKIAGQRIAHAWVEYGDLVLDDSNGAAYTGLKEGYYSIGQIKEEDVVRYTYREALSKAVRFGHYGPWDE